VGSRRLSDAQADGILLAALPLPVEVPRGAHGQRLHPPHRQAKRYSRGIGQAHSERAPLISLMQINDTSSITSAPSQKCAVPSLQEKIQNRLAWSTANLLLPVMPPACLRTTQVVETASRRTARTRHRFGQGPRCHMAGSTAGPARSWHQPAAAPARAEATPRSCFAPCSAALAKSWRRQQLTSTWRTRCRQHRFRQRHRSKVPPNMTRIALTILAVLVLLAASVRPAAGKATRRWPARATARRSALRST